MENQTEKLELPWPPAEVHRDVLEHLELVLNQEHEDMQLLKLHLYTEHLLNLMLESYLRTNRQGIDKLRLGYAKKVDLLRVARIIPQPAADVLRTLNKIRQKLAHELTYALSQIDKDELLKDAPAEITMPKGTPVLRAIAPYLAGLLSGGVARARDVKEAISAMKNPLAADKLAK